MNDFNYQTSVINLDLTPKQVDAIIAALRFDYYHSRKVGGALPVAVEDQEGILDALKTVAEAAGAAGMVLRDAHAR
jgi:hypothetical protein